MGKSTVATVTATTHTITQPKFSVQPATAQNKNPIVDTLWHCETIIKLAKNAIAHEKP